VKRAHLFFLLLLISTNSFSQTTYACFEYEKNLNLKIPVSFDKEEIPQFVRYAGQKDSIRLKFSKSHWFENSGGIPAYYWSKTYFEIHRGKVTGEYSFTNSGTYGLDVIYTRKKDRRVFYFRIIESFIEGENGVFREKPCF
jgi:hypothetical protein